MAEAWDEEKGEKPAKPISSGCCFWFRMFPPIKWFLSFMKWLFLSKMEYKVLKIARKLFAVVNADEACCADCPYRHLSKMERMYLHRILKDQARWGSDYRQFIKTFQSQIIAMQKEESDAGESVTEAEFCNAVLYATQEYMEKIVKKMHEEIKKEYKADEKLAGAP